MTTHKKDNAGKALAVVLTGVKINDFRPGKSPLLKKRCKDTNNLQYRKKLKLL